MRTIDVDAPAPGGPGAADLEGVGIVHRSVRRQGSVTQVPVECAC